MTVYHRIKSSQVKTSITFDLWLLLKPCLKNSWITPRWEIREHHMTFLTCMESAERCYLGSLTSVLSERQWQHVLTCNMWWSEVTSLSEQQKQKRHNDTPSWRRYRALCNQSVKRSSSVTDVFYVYSLLQGAFATAGRRSKSRQTAN